MPPDLTLKSLWSVAREAVDGWIDNRGASLGAALAYYTVFSIAPLLLIVIAVAGLAFGDDAARGEIFEELRGLMGADAAHAVQGLLESARRPEDSLLATVIGVGVLLLGATTVFGELQATLDQIWRVPARPQAGGLWALVRTRFLSFGMILGIGFLMIVSLVLSAVISALGKWWDTALFGWTFLAGVVNFVVGFGFTTVVFAMIYKIMPRARIDWRDVWTGAAVTSLLFTIGKSLIGIYIGKSGVASGYGAAGSLVVVLVWVYYSAQIFLFGAEFTWAYAHRFGSRRGISRAAEDAAMAAGTVALSPEPPPPEPLSLPARAVVTAAAIAAASAAVAVAGRTAPPPPDADPKP